MTVVFRRGNEKKFVLVMLICDGGNVRIWTELTAQGDSATQCMP